MKFEDAEIKNNKIIKILSLHKLLKYILMSIKNEKIMI